MNAREKLKRDVLAAGEVFWQDSMDAYTGPPTNPEHLEHMHKVFLAGFASGFAYTRAKLSEAPPDPEAP